MAEAAPSDDVDGLDVQAIDRTGETDRRFYSPRAIQMIDVAATGCELPNRATGVDQQPG